MIEAKVLITDVDNTLFDWFNVWYQSFSAMIEEVERISGISREQLYPEIRKIHQRVGTSEYSLLLSEMPTLQKKFGKDNIVTHFDSAIRAFREKRRENLRLYPGVIETFDLAKKSGVRIVAYTESQAFYTAYRFRKLGLDKIVDYLFSPPDHDIPEGVSRLSMRSRPQDSYNLAKTIHGRTPPDEKKPNPVLLLDIIREIGAKPNECIYVGDSLFKDIAMAADANVTSFYAKYGVSHSLKEYDLLREVTHWTDEDVNYEKGLRDREVVPNYILENNFGELNNYVSWRRFK